MSQETQFPTIKSEDRGGTTETHPAYAQIAAARVSCGGPRGGTVLYGSEFRQGHYMTVSILRSELHREHSRDWAHAREEYIEVSLTEAQWATFISTPNSGGGVQCTLNHLMGAKIPDIAVEPQRKKQFQGELHKTMAFAQEQLRKLKQEIDELKVSEKQKSALKSTLHMAQMNIEGNVQFVADQFAEHIETVTEHAKIEVEGYMAGLVRRTGLQALQGKISPELEGTDPKGWNKKDG